MSDTEFDELEPMESVAESADARPPCVALVPVVASTQWSHLPNQAFSRADPSFVTHLIATAEHVPQTCSLRRATLADAQAAYRSVTDHNHLTAIGRLTRQTS
jgi:hypothetical protein